MLEIGPLVKESSFTKGLGTRKNIKAEASAIEYLKGSYQSVSPKTLKEGG